MSSEQINVFNTTDVAYVDPYSDKLIAGSVWSKVPSTKYTDRLLKNGVLIMGDDADSTDAVPEGEDASESQVAPEPDDATGENTTEQE